jgi:hypothetical protein
MRFTLGIMRFTLGILIIMYFYVNYLKKNLSIVYMNYKCECCNVSFNTPSDQRRHLLTSKHIKNAETKTPNDYETEIFNLKHEYENELMKMKHEMEIMKKDHQIELLQVKNEMYEKFLNMKQEPKNETTTTQQEPQQSPQETESDIDGREFYKIVNDIKEEVELCESIVFKKDNKEYDQERSIFNLESDNLNEEHFKLYPLFCDLMKAKGENEPMDMFMNYLEDYIQPEDYKISPNIKTTDRIYFVKTSNTWYTEVESNNHIEDLMRTITNKFNEFSQSVFIPIRDKYKTETTPPLAIMNMSWWIRRCITTESVIKKLVKNKKDSMK